MGEGAIWNPLNNLLYWVDITGCALHWYNPATGTNHSRAVSSMIGTVVPETDTTVIAALQDGIYRVSTDTGAETLLGKPFSNPDLRFNDGKCDPRGRFWAGTTSLSGKRNSAALYRMDADSSIHTMLEGVSISNGIVWSADRKTMYYIDTPICTVQAFDYEDETGSISNRRDAFSIAAGGGFPDGMTMDEEGMLWIAMWGAGCINRYNPATGQLLLQISVPAPHVSSCAFGGADLSTLYITTARVELSDAQLQRYPQSGSLFSVQPGFRGVSANIYRSSPAFAG